MFKRCLIPAILFAATQAYATPPQQISVQGVLRDGSGHLQSMQVQVTVRFYDAASGGNLLASFGPTSVVAQNGLFTEVLSLDAATAASIQGASSVFMEITAGNDTFSRQPVTSDLFALSAGIADNAVKLGGAPASAYQRTLINSDCGAGSVIRAIAPNGTVTCAPQATGTVTSVSAAAPLTSSGGANPTIGLNGDIGVANGGNRFGGAWATYFVGQQACLQQSGANCYLRNPTTNACSCPSGFTAYPIAENYNAGQNFTNCTWMCLR